MKTYETIECGNMLDAMTDLTGAICEFFNPDVNPPENIFHLLYKSSVNRSLMVCWRNEKRLTPSGFHCGNQQDVSLSQVLISLNMFVGGVLNHDYVANSRNNVFLREIVQGYDSSSNRNNCSNFIFLN